MRNKLENPMGPIPSKWARIETKCRKPEIAEAQRINPMGLTNWAQFVLIPKRESKKKEQSKSETFHFIISEPGFDPGTCGLWAHHASAAPL